MHIDTGMTGEFRYKQSDILDQDEAEAGITPSQTVGPYVHIGLTLEGSELVVDEGDEGAIEISFEIFDGDGNPIADAMVETWQSDAEGVFNSPLDPRTGDKATVEGFRGLGRAMANDDGVATITTIYPGGFEGEAPHLNVGILARGILERLYTRLYFPENADANAADPILTLVDEARRELLVAEKTDDGYHLTIHVQHEDPAKETPFFKL